MNLATIVSDFWLQVIIQGLIAGAALSMAWGSAKAKSQMLSEKMSHIEIRLEQIEADVTSDAKAASDRFVSRQEFISALLDIKDQGLAAYDVGPHPRDY